MATYNLTDSLQESLPLYPVVTRGAYRLLQDESAQAIDFWPFFTLDVSLAHCLWRHVGQLGAVSSQALDWQQALAQVPAADLKRLLHAALLDSNKWTVSLPAEIEPPDQLAEKALIGAFCLQHWAVLLSLDPGWAYALGLMSTLEGYLVWLFFQKHTGLVRDYFELLRKGLPVPWSVHPAQVAVQALVQSGFPEQRVRPLLLASQPPGAPEALEALEAEQPWVLLLQGLPSWVDLIAQGTKARSMPCLYPAVGITESALRHVCQQVRQSLQAVSALFRCY
jgi:hypothetical protein